MLISQPYIKVHRKIEDNVQQKVEITEELILYENKIISATDQFNLNEVLDVSFKSISSTNGFLYLHTIRGVYPYQIKTNPEEFIHMYEQVKNY
ncbi:hypothetical protein [Bacillus sp. B15-48]|uniref:hypothetical protein n=1 Tax=Bacillus sp. B15-48 TaxID=1548601 RepID=UPI00193F0677|nr:hypothetical protein [Bacillus sp. B15-48]MBM4762675.1 hypothetical protein [Bacillus sp. B15-48]